MDFDKITILSGESIKYISLDKTMDKDELIKTHNLQATDICSTNLTKKLKDIIQKKNESVREMMYEYAAQYRDAEWKLLSDHCDLDFEGGYYKTSCLINDSMTYLILKIKKYTGKPKTV